MGLKKHVPNFITLLNLLCGCIAILFAVYDKLEIAALLVMLGIFFDFFDGLAARVLKVQSDLGLQLDSLADMVTSGVVPGIVMFQLLTRVFGKPFYESSDTWNSGELVTTLDFSYVSLLGFCITLASAYRLAKFNIDTRQTTSFIGLPTPANTILILSLPLILMYQNEAWVSAIILSPYFLIGLTLLSCYLLNAEIPLFALKFKTWGFKENKVRYIFLILVLLLIVILKFMAVPVIILTYILLSVFTNHKSLRTEMN